MRSDESDNPLHGYGQGSIYQQKLPWRRPTGAECAICVFAIDNHSEYAAKKATLAEENKDPQKLKDCMANCVHPYEEQKKSTRRRVKKAKQEVVNVSADTYSSFDYEKMCGILWPVKLHDAKFGKAGKKGISTHVIDGKKIRGIVKSEALGNPEGTYKIGSKSGSSITMSTKRSSQDDMEDETEQLFEKGQKRMRMNLSQSGKDEAATFKMSSLDGAPAVKGQDDSDDDLLTDIWGKRILKNNPMLHPRRTRKRNPVKKQRSQTDEKAEGKGNGPASPRQVQRPRQRNAFSNDSLPTRKLQQRRRRLNATKLRHHRRQRWLKSSTPQSRSCWLSSRLRRR